MRIFSILTMLTMTTALGCGADPKPPVAPTDLAVTNATPNTSGPKQDVATPSSGSIHIAEDIVKACGDLPNAHFAFDSASVTGEAETGLAALAKCFATGPLKGRTMRLVGRADPRGTPEYNLGLGQKRSGSVGTFIQGHGVAADHVQTTSRGEQDATGTDEQGWARDRRVDISLAP